jgi:hypothetical protein
VCETWSSTLCVDKQLRCLKTDCWRKYLDLRSKRRMEEITRKASEKSSHKPWIETCNSVTNWMHLYSNWEQGSARFYCSFAQTSRGCPILRVKKQFSKAYKNFYENVMLIFTNKKIYINIKVSDDKTRLFESHTILWNIYIAYIRLPYQQCGQLHPGRVSDRQNSPFVYVETDRGMKM